MKNNTKKGIALLLALLLLCSSFAYTLTAFAEESESSEGDGLTSWTFLRDDWGVSGTKWVNDFYDSSPFEYVYFYYGSQPSDTRKVGFYQLSANNDSENPRYIIPTDVANNYCSGISSAYAGYVYFPTDSYAPGICFTAPFSGTIEFRYYLWTGGISTVGLNVYRNSVSKADLVHSADLAESQYRYNTPTESNLQTLSVKVTEGDKIYFLADCLNNYDSDWMNFWFRQVLYTALDSPFATKATLIGQGLSTEDDLASRFFIQYDGIPAGYDVTVTVHTPSGDVDYHPQGYSWVDLTGESGKICKSGDFIYYYTVDLTARQMTDEITVSVKKGSDEKLTNQKSITIEDYLQHWIAHYYETGYRKVIAKSCASLLLYGKTSQKLYNYRTDKLPTVDNDLLQCVWEEYYDGTGADLSKLPTVKTNTDMEDAVKITSNDLLSLIRSGNIERNGKYEVSDTTGLVFTSADAKKTYNLKNATISFSDSVTSALDLSGTRYLTISNVNIIAGGNTAVYAKNAKNLTLSLVSVQGTYQKGIEFVSGSCTISECSVLNSAKTFPAYGIYLGCDDVTVINSQIKNCSCGIYDETTNGAVIENNLVESCSTGIQSATSGSTVWYNTIRKGTIGILASFDKAEISAVYAKGHNIIVAVNKITDTETGISFANISNGVVLLNTTANISVIGGINNYVIENAVSKKLTLKNNNYLIADENTVADLESVGNTNMNGDNVTDVNARAECGVNEDILPHVNNDLFTGMTRSTKVKSSGESLELCKYLASEFETKKIVIVPPGAYLNSGMSYTNVSDVTVYAYGVLNELSTVNENGLYLDGCNDFTLKGMTFTTAVSPTTQGTVTAVKKVGNKTCISFVADEGYPQNFCSSAFGDTSPGNLYRADSLVPYSEVYYSNKSYDEATNTNVIEDSNATGDVKVGDRIAFRNGMGSGATSFYQCSNCLLKDITVFACSGFCEYDVDCDIAPTLYRYAIVAGPAPVLDSTKTHTDVGSVNWTDSYGRLRSGNPILTTCDATHSSNNRIGIQIISCRFEQMFDDGGNINARYGLSVSFDSTSKTLTYRVDDTVYKLICHSFSAGDEVIIFNQSGKLIGRSTATSDSVALGNDRYSVTLADNIEGVEERMIVQNLTWSSNGFLVDNVLVKNNNSNGFRIKASNGKVINCTFENLAKCGISFIPEYQNWPEAGFAENVEISNNVFRHVGEIHQIWEGGTPCLETIVIKNGGVVSSDPDYCLHQNILITDNVFEDCMTSYDIGITCAQNVTISNNQFKSHNVTTGEHGAMIFYGGLNITVSDNTYATDGEKITIKESASQIKGTDLSQ